jgi:immunoglobulin-like protein involved in spore germination/sporulation and spore germination protein
LSSPSGIDPDYRSVWSPGWTLNAPVRHAGGVITVDLRQPSGAPLSTPVSIELARLGVQQLVYTVQDALASTDPVRILLGGAPVDRFWGSLTLAAPVARADPLNVRALVQIDSPGQAAVFNQPGVRVSGDAATAEGDVQWQVLRGDTVVAHGHATTEQSLVFSPYTFTVQLQPGEYTVRVAESDAADGEGRPAMADTKAITVVAGR